MSETVRFLTTSDGMQTFFRHWAADERRGVVVCLHGIQSHSGWYHRTSRALSASGFEVYFVDRRGSGLNKEARGHADHGERLLNDVAAIIDLVRHEHPGLPITLLGLSWGGKTALAFARSRRRAIEQLVLLYPGIAPRLRPNLWQRFLLWFARSHDLRRKPVRLPLNDPTLFTCNSQHQSFIQSDSQALHKVTSGFLNSGLDLDRLIQVSKNELPQTLLMLAGDDVIIDNKRTQQMLTAMTSVSLDVITYPDARHTLEFEDCCEQYLSDLLNWLREASSDSSAQGRK